MEGRHGMSDTVRIRVLQELQTKGAAAREAATHRGTTPISDSQRLFQALYDAALIADVQGNISDANSRALTFLLYDYDDLCSMNVIEVISGADTSLLESLNANLDRGCFSLIDAICVRQDGSEFPAEIAVTRVLLVGQTNLCFYVRDITKRKRAEEEHQELEIQVRHVQKLESLGLLAGGIAHDFNNLLVSILGNADLALRKIPGDSVAKGNLLEIEKASSRAAELCRQLLAYSGKGKFVIEILDLSHVVEEMAKMLEVSITKKCVLQYSSSVDLPAIEADATQVRQVVMNLITNASDAIGDRSGIVAITTACKNCDEAFLTSCYLGEHLPPGRYVSVAVADTGCGMDAKTMDRIFDPFFTTKFTGRGLGLAAVSGIMRGHKGAIRVESEPGKGTTFEVLFPAVDGKPSDTRREPARSSEWTGVGTILIVDDEETVRMVGQQMLEQAGFTVITAEDGSVGVETFVAHHGEICCVILDLTMPNMDGEETFRELRRIKPDVRVLMSSGYSEQEISSRFAGQRLMGFIHKPYRSSELYAKVRSVLEA